MAGRRLAARDDFRLIVIRPVVEAGSKPGAACFAASSSCAALAAAALNSSASRSSRAFRAFCSVAV